MPVKSTKKIQITEGAWAVAHAHNVAVSAILGLPAGTLFQSLSFWIEKNRQDNNIDVYKDGVYWTYNTQEKWQERMPELTKKQIVSGLDKLREAKLIRTAKHSPFPNGSTLWYTYGEVSVKELVLNSDDVEVITPSDDKMAKSLDIKAKNSVLSQQGMQHKLNNKKVLSAQDYKNMFNLLTSWNRRGGTKHTLAEDGQEQKTTIHTILSAYSKVKQGLLAFYRHYEADWDQRWLSKNCINEETIKASTVSVVDAMILHTALISETKDKRAEKRKLPTYNKDEKFPIHDKREAKGSLIDFFTTTFDDKKKSWLLYWICKDSLPQEKEEAELYTSPYSSEDSLFRSWYRYTEPNHYLRKIFGNTSKWTITQKNEMFRFVDKVIESFAPYTISSARYTEKDLGSDWEDYRRNYMINLKRDNLKNYFADYYSGASGYTELRGYMLSKNGFINNGVGSKNWGYFLDYISQQEKDNSKFQKKKYLLGIK